MEILEYNRSILYKINELENYLKGKSLSIIGLIDGIGYSNNVYNYLDELINSIKIKQNGLTVINAHFQTICKEHTIEDFIASNLSLREIKKIQQQENEETIKRKLEEIPHMVPDKKLISLARYFLKIKEREIESCDSNIYLKDALQNHQDVNIFYSSNTRCIDEFTPNWYLEREQKQRERNYNYILSINPDAQIYTIGLIAPNDHPNTIRAVKKQNHFYQKLASEYGSIYIYPDGLEKAFKKGILTEYGISILTSKCIEAMYQKKIQEPTHTFHIETPKIKVEKKGIDYLLEKGLEVEKKLSPPSTYEQFIIDEIGREKTYQKIYTKAKEDHFS